MREGRVRRLPGAVAEPDLLDDHGQPEQAVHLVEGPVADLAAGAGGVVGDDLGARRHARAGAHGWRRISWNSSSSSACTQYASAAPRSISGSPTVAISQSSTARTRDRSSGSSTRLSKPPVAVHEHGAGRRPAGARRARPSRPRRPGRRRCGPRGSGATSPRPAAGRSRRPCHRSRSPAASTSTACRSASARNTPSPSVAGLLRVERDAGGQVRAQDQPGHVLHDVAVRARAVVRRARAARAGSAGAAGAARRTRGAMSCAPPASWPAGGRRSTRSRPG